MSFLTAISRLRRRGMFVTPLPNLKRKAYLLSNAWGYGVTVDRLGLIRAAYHGTQPLTACQR